MERTFVRLKPDCMRKKLVGTLVSLLENAGLSIVGMKMVSLAEGVLDVDYEELKDKPFFPGLKEFMKSTPVVLSVWEGKNAVVKLRELCGPTDSRKAPK
ncbi:MAG: nucleoside-diphosphate kinase, partial [Candidatus Micrarchaeota archaeon]